MASTSRSGSAATAWAWNWCLKDRTRVLPSTSLTVASRTTAAARGLLRRTIVRTSSQILRTAAASIAPGIGMSASAAPTGGPPLVTALLVAALLVAALLVAALVVGALLVAALLVTAPLVAAPPIADGLGP